MKKKIITASLILLLIIITIIFLTQNKLINNIYTNYINKINEPPSDLEISYIVYDNKDLNNIKCLLKISSNIGLNQVTNNDEIKINANGKKDLYIDYNAILNEEKNMKIKLLSGEEINKAVKIDENVLSNQVVINSTQNEADYEDSIEYIKKNESDKTYYKTYLENSWREYSNNISLISPITADYIVNAQTENVDSVLYLKKEDIAGNILYTNKNCRLNIIKGNLDVFNYVQSKGGNLTEYGFEDHTPHNGYYGFSPYNLRYGHDYEDGNFSGYFTFNPSKLKIFKIEKITVEFMQRSIRGFARSSVEINYTDGTTETRTVDSHTGNEWTSYSAEIEPDFNKTISYIKFNIWGRDELYGGEFEAYVKNINIDTQIIDNVEYI